MFRYFITLTIFLNLLFCNTVELTQKEKQFLKTHPIIVLGSSSGWAPASIQNENGPITGFDVDILKEVNKATGANFTLEIGNWDEIQKKAQERQIDGLCTLVQTPQRDKYFNFTKPFNYILNIIVTTPNKKDTIKTKEDLINKTIAIEKGHILNKKIVDELGIKNIIYVDTVVDSYKKIFNDETDIAIGYSGFRYQLSKTGLPLLIDTNTYYKKTNLQMAIRNDWPEAISILQKGLDSINQVKKEELKEKWQINLEDTNSKINLTKEEKEYLLNKKTLKIYTEPQWKPFSFMENGQAKGFLEDLKKLFAQKTGLKLEEKELTFEKVDKAFNNKEIDILLAATPFLSEKNKETLVISDRPLFVFVNSIVSKKGYRNPSELKDKKVGYLAGIPYLYKNYTNIKPIPYPDEISLFDALMNNEIEAALDEYRTIVYYIKEFGFQDILKNYTYDLENAINIYPATNKENKLLLNIFDKVITKQDIDSLKLKWGLFTEEEQSDANALTSEEKEYLDLKKELNVCVRTDSYPISGQKNNKIIGITGDILNKVADELKITLKPYPLKTLEDFKTNNCDILTSIPQNIKMVDNIKATKTSLFNTMALTVGNFTHPYIEKLEENNIFYVHSKVFKHLLNMKYPQLNIVYDYDLNRIMTEVKNNYNAHFVTNSIIADYVIQKFGPDKFKIINRLEDLEAQISIGVASDDQILLNILDKSLNKLGTEFINNIVDIYKINEYKIENYKWLWFVVWILVIIVIIAQYRYLSLTKEKQKELLEYSKYLSESHQLAKMGTFQFDFRTSLLKLSKEFQTMIGMNNSDMINLQAFIKIVHPNDVENIYKKIEEVVRENNTEPFSFRIITDNHIKYLDIHWNNIKNSEGKVIKAEGYAQNITQKILLEKEDKRKSKKLEDYKNNLEIKVKEQTKKLADYVEASTDFVWEVDTKSTYLYVSDGVKNIFGYTAEELIGKSLFDFMSKNESERLSKIFTNLVKNQKRIENLEHTHTHKNGEKVVFLTNGIPVYKNNNLIGYRGTAKDITLQKEQEKKILEQKESLHISQRLAHMANWEILYPSKKFIISNEFRLMYGIKENTTYTLDDLITIIHDEDKESAKQSLTNLFDNPYEGSSQYKISVEGRIKYIDVHWKLIYENEKLIKFQGYSQDVTEKKQNELLLLEQTKLISMSEMIGNIAHQWRQPLSAISTAASGMNLSFQMGDVTKEDMDYYNQVILDSTQHLSNTINTFRDFIIGDNKKEEISICKALYEAIILVEDSLKNNHIRIINNLHCEECSNKQVYLSKQEFSQATINILNNAKDIIIKRNIKDAWIKINHFVKDSTVIITIEDNAEGIAKEILPKIFEPYFTTKHQSQGTGLGLYMSYKIITESIGGKIYAKNSENGAIFFIELPLT